MASPDVLFLCTGNYYRSRFAEELFNDLSRGAGVALVAASRGLRIPTDGRNPGPMSPHAAKALAALGITPAEPVRVPAPAIAADLAAARLVVGLQEAEHRPMVEAQFPDAAVVYWDVPDTPHMPPAQALSRIETRVRQLHGELLGGA